MKKLMILVAVLGVFLLSSCSAFDAAQEASDNLQEGLEEVAEEVSQTTNRALGAETVSVGSVAYTVSFLHVDESGIHLGWGGKEVAVVARGETKYVPEGGIWVFYPDTGGNYAWVTYDPVK